MWAYAEKCTNYCWSSCLCLDNLDVDVETIAGSKGYVLASLFLFCGGGQCLACNRKGLNGDNPFKWSDSQRRECDFNRPRSTYFFPLLFFPTLNKKKSFCYRAAASFNFLRLKEEESGVENKKKWPLVFDFGHTKCQWEVDGTTRKKGQTGLWKG